MNREAIEKKVDILLEKRRHEEDGDKYVKKCLKTRTCPACGKGLNTEEGRNFYCPGCKLSFSIYLYYPNASVNAFFKNKEVI